MATRMTLRTVCARCCGRVLVAILALAPALTACLPPAVSLVGKACNDNHPCGTDLVCCGGRCQQSCETPRCPESSCGLQRAIACAAAPQVCLDQCWESCAACSAICSDGDLKQCQDESSGESWFCRGEEVCLVHVAATRTADCRVPPPQCLDQPSCTCLAGPWALYPFCDAWEACVDLPGGAIGCRSTVSDAGMVDSGGHMDAGAADFGGYDGASSADASSMDSGLRDHQVTADSGASDAGAHDAGGSDAGSSDAHSGSDGAAADAGGHDAGTPCGPLAPDCFAAIGSGPTGALCCSTTGRPATCIGTSWRCPTGLQFATRCNGFGDFCMNGTTPDCDADNPCVWSWTGTGGELQCTAFGPTTPCSGGDWTCIAGTSLRASCDCVEPDCPG